MSFITNWVQDKAAGYLATGIQAGGTLAGNAVGSVGTLIENSGKGVANGVTGGVNGVGGYINGYGQGIINSTAADGPVGTGPKKTAVKPTAATKDTPAKVLQTSQKGLPGAGAATKALPSTAQRALPAAPSPKPRAAAPRPTPAKPKSPAPVKPKATAGTPKAPGATDGPKGVTDGKVRISAASRPKPAGAVASKTPAKPNVGAGGKPAVASRARPVK